MEVEILALYESLLLAWNQQDAMAYGLLFTDDGSLVGFDGSELNTPREIVDTLAFVFSQHPTARFVSVVREIRALDESNALLRANVGMVPRNTTVLNPAVNAIQSLTAQKMSGVWKIAHFQNTPAAFHGRPADQEKLTRELQGLVNSGLTVRVG